MSAAVFKHVCLESIATFLPDIEVSSAELEDRIAPLYQRLEIPFGTLEKLSGVKTRYFWERNVMPSMVSTSAAERALDGIGFDRKHLGAIFNCSVTRDYFEPATATLVHRNLGLSETAMGLDITNACVGFSNGMMMLGNLIESGVVKAGLLVSGENVAMIIDSCIAHLAGKNDLSREQLVKLLPVLTLGSGAVAAVLCHDSIATQNHRILGSVCHTASQFNDLCSGDGDYCASQGSVNPLMYTESSKLIASAAQLGHRTWTETSETFGWSKDDVNHVFCHQVGRQVNDAFYKEIGLDYQKEFTIYRKYGNLVSAALPTAFTTGIQEKPVKSGDKVILLGFGSGLNSIFTAISW